MRATHTYAVLEISKSAYTEIREKLIEAGYQHVFHESDTHGEVIDMQGIAVADASKKDIPASDYEAFCKQRA